MSNDKYFSRNPRVGEIIRFLLVGGGATVLDCVVLAALSAWSTFSPSRSFVIAFMISVFCRFLFDRQYTFRLHGSFFERTVWGELVRYTAGTCVPLALGSTLFYGAMSAGCTVMLAKIISIPPVTGAGYFIFKYIAFRMGRSK